MSFDLDHTFGISIKIQRLLLRYLSITAIEIKTFIEKICADKSGVLEVVSIR
jgi:hypothetical protein